MPSRCTLLACAFAYTLGGPLGERHFDLDSSTPGSLCAPTRFDFRFNGLGGFGELCSLAKLGLFLPESFFVSTTFLRMKLRFNKYLFAPFCRTAQDSRNVMTLRGSLAAQLGLNRSGRRERPAPPSFSPSALARLPLADLLAHTQMMATPCNPLSFSVFKELILVSSGNRRNDSTHGSPCPNIAGRIPGAISYIQFFSNRAPERPERHRLHPFTFILLASHRMFLPEQTLPCNSAKPGFRCTQQTPGAGEGRIWLRLFALAAMGRRRGLNALQSGKGYTRGLL